MTDTTTCETISGEKRQPGGFGEPCSRRVHAILQFGQDALFSQHAQQTIKPHFWQVRLPESVIVWRQFIQVLAAFRSALIWIQKKIPSPTPARTATGKSRKTICIIHVYRARPSAGSGSCFWSGTGARRGSCRGSRTRPPRWTPPVLSSNRISAPPAWPAKRSPPMMLHPALSPPMVSGNTAKLKTLPGFSWMGFRFDVGHARQVDPTMNVVYLVGRQRRLRLWEVHIGEGCFRCRHNHDLPG